MAQTHRQREREGEREKRDSTYTHAIYPKTLQVLGKFESISRINKTPKAEAEASKVPQLANRIENGQWPRQSNAKKKQKKKQKKNKYNKRAQQKACVNWHRKKGSEKKRTKRKETSQ